MMKYYTEKMSKGTNYMNTIKQLRECTGLSQSKFASLFGIPTRTLQHWEMGNRKPPEYVVRMMEEILINRGYDIEHDERFMV